MCDFDKICTKYNGKDLLELLERVYTMLDTLCEHYAVQRLETVGGTYIACGGLQMCEHEVDPALLINDHSVRVAEFAISAKQSMKQIILKSGQ